MSLKTTIGSLKSGDPPSGGRPEKDPEGPPSQANPLGPLTESSQDAERRPDANPIERRPIRGFEPLSDDEVKKVQMTLKKVILGSDIKSGEAPKDASPGLFRDSDGQEYILVHKNFTEGDPNFIYALIVEISSILDIPVCLIQRQEGPFFNQARPEFLHEYSLGLLLTITARSHMQLTSRESMRALGQVHAMAIRARGHFRRCFENAEQFLKKDHALLGNNPGEVDERNTEVAFGIKLRITAQFEKRDVGAAYANLVITLLDRLGLVPLSGQETDLQLRQLVVPFNEYIKRYAKAPSVEERPGKGPRRKKHKEKEKRLPKRPLPSPVFTENENDLIRRCVSVKWSELDSVQKNWVELVLSGRGMASIDHLSSVFRDRHILIQKYASLTSKRLRTLREVLPESRKRLPKREIKNLDLALLSSKIDDSVEITSAQIFDTFGMQVVSEAISSRDLNRPVAPSECLGDSAVIARVKDTIRRGILTASGKVEALALVSLARAQAKADVAAASKTLLDQIFNYHRCVKDILCRAHEWAMNVATVAEKDGRCYVAKFGDSLALKRVQAIAEMKPELLQSAWSDWKHTRIAGTTALSFQDRCRRLMDLEFKVLRSTDFESQEQNPDGSVPYKVRLLMGDKLLAELRSIAGAGLKQSYSLSYTRERELEELRRTFAPAPRTLASVARLKQVPSRPSRASMRTRS